MGALLSVDYQGAALSFQDDGWFNATQAANKYGKAPAEWLRLPSTLEYIGALKRHNPSMGKSHRSKPGPTATGGGTWLHPKLAVRFAQWLNADFAVWCDAQIDSLLREKDDWRKLRHQSASSFKVANDILKMVRSEQGKDTESHHYSNEARLVNWALAGEFKGLDRNSMSAENLALLAHLEERNAVLIGRGIGYDQRKPMLKQYAMDWRMVNTTALEA